IVSHLVRIASPAAVGTRPSGVRFSSLAPSCFSSSATRRPTLTWLTPKERAAPERLPSRAAARKKRRSSHCHTLFTSVQRVYRCEYRLPSIASIGFVLQLDGRIQTYANFIVPEVVRGRRWIRTDRRARGYRDQPCAVWPTRGGFSRSQTRGHDHPGERGKG